MKRTIKVKSAFLTLTLAVALFVGCGKVATPTPSIKAPSTASTSPTLSASPTTSALGSPIASPDVKTTASIVNTTEAFEKAISKTGTWIIALLNDLTINKDLVLDGEFKNGKKDASGKDVIQRKIALYTQDENRKVTNRFTLTAPKLTINSPKASIQHGTYKGDLYVSSKDFELVDATVDGNVYFLNDDAKTTFKMDSTSKVTGKQELKK